jgi:hypothetical protein
VDFSLNSEQSVLRDSVDRYWCATGSAVGSRWSDFARLGWLSVAVPEEPSDLGRSLVNTTILMEEFGRHHASEPFVPCAVVAARLAHEAGADGGGGPLFREIVSGTAKVAVASGLTEQVTDCRFEADLDLRAPGRRYLLRGARAVIATVAAEKVIVPAMTTEGLTLFAVNCAAEGVSRRIVRGIDGSDTAEISIDGARVADSGVLGRRGAGERPLRAALEHGIVALCAESVGAMTGVLHSTRHHLRQRRQYGASLSSYQVLQHRLADMFADVELSRSMLYAALAAMTGPDPESCRRMLLSAGSYIGSRGRQVGEAAVQLHGATGMTAESDVGRYFRRLVGISCALIAVKYADEAVSRHGEGSPEATGYRHECYAAQ